MNFRNLILLVPAFISQLSVHARDPQLRSSPSGPDQRLKAHLIDSIEPAGRNELYLNIAPYFCTLLGAFPDNEVRYSFFYKRVLDNPRKALRFGFTYRPEVVQYDGPAYYSESNVASTLVDYYEYSSDTTRIRDHYMRGPRRPFQLNAGMEWRTKNTKLRWSAFVGLDFTGGVYSRKYTLTDYYELQKPDSSWVLDASQGLPKVIAEEKTIGWYAGIYPTAGIRYALNGRWMLSVSGGMDAYVEKGTDFRRNAAITALSGNTASTFNFQIGSMLNEFSVVYRF